MKGKKRVEEEWQFDLERHHFMEYRGEDLLVMVQTHHNGHVVRVSALDIGDRVRYWAAIEGDGVRRSGREELETAWRRGKWDYDLRPSIAFQMTPADQEEMLRLMRRAMSYNKEPLSESAGRAWDEALELVRQAETTEKTIILWERDPEYDEDDFDLDDDFYD